jgi:hypothetical protein
MHKYYEQHGGNLAAMYFTAIEGGGGDLKGNWKWAEEKWHAGAENTTQFTNKSLTPINCEEVEYSNVLGVTHVSKLASSIIWELSWITPKTEAVGFSERSY